MFDTMEPETKLYLKKIMRTIFIGIFWMFFHIIVGIFLEYSFINGKPTTANIIYYCILIISLFFLIRYFWQQWKHGK
jgi:sterol desaturase/sphingolipid hydroxylase (fatty acid hydroxylase superfamily)